MAIIYHNPRCAKSREALAYLTERGAEVDVVEYMKDPLTPGQMEELLDALSMEPADLIRTQEKLWKEEFADKELEREELILAMIEHPQLMERPIVVHQGKAVVARPIDRLQGWI